MDKLHISSFGRVLQHEKVEMVITIQNDSDDGCDCMTLTTPAVPANYSDFLEAEVNGLIDFINAYWKRMMFLSSAEAEPSEASTD